MDGRESKLIALVLSLTLFIVFAGCGEETYQPVNPQIKIKKKSKKENNVSQQISQEDMGLLEETYTYMPAGRRDPFRSPLLGLREKKATGLTPLQQRSLSELRVIGIIWSSEGYLAMIETPDGKGYVIKKGTLVGPDGGVVEEITKNSIIIEERFRDIYGKWRVRKTELKLHAKEEVDG